MMSTFWTLGSEEDCDLTVALPGVSGHHARLRYDETGCYLQDSKSRNGTYVNGERLVGDEERKVGPRDRITLGKTAPMPWPAAVVTSETVLRLGREPENEIVVDVPMVSGRHARVGWDARHKVAWIEDLGSANGTSLGVPGRIQGRVLFTRDDQICLGTHEVSGEWLLSHLKVAASPRADVVAASASPLARTNSRGIRVAVLLGQAALIGVLIAVIGNAAGEPSVKAAAIASLLAIAAVWFGLSAVVWEWLVEPSFFGWIVRLFWMALACVGSCAIAWGIVALISGIKADATQSIALMAMASMAGLAIGSLIVALVSSPRDAMVAAVAVIAVSVPFGSAWSPSRTGTEVLPSRWAFEGLLLLESKHAAEDLAEPYFAAASSRSGVRACVMALGFMIAGFGGASAVIAWGPRSASPPKTPLPA